MPLLHNLPVMVTMEVLVGHLVAGGNMSLALGSPKTLSLLFHLPLMHQVCLRHTILPHLFQSMRYHTHLRTAFLPRPPRRRVQERELGLT